MVVSNSLQVAFLAFCYKNLQKEHIILHIVSVIWSWIKNRLYPHLTVAIKDRWQFVSCLWVTYLLHIHPCLCFVISFERVMFRFCVQGSHASWKVLDFFLENSRTWKVLEKHFGPVKSWKLKLKVPESPGKISWKLQIFYWFWKTSRNSKCPSFCWLLPT